MTMKGLSGKDIISSLEIAKTTKIITFPVCDEEPDFPRAILIIWNPHYASGRDCMMIWINKRSIYQQLKQDTKY